jgi:diketogulonate reductase-like aldo/keto reductase
MSSATAVRTMTLPSGDKVPVLGQGTWHTVENRARRPQEIRALQLGLDLGMTLIDTAEMYGNGASEELAGEAIAGRREEVFLVSKVLPGNASAKGTIAACERSLRRLKTDRLELYLLHWRGQFPFEETIAAFQTLISAGKIRQWGVSNLDISEMPELVSLPGGGAVATNQVLYNLTRRGVEYDLLPWCGKQSIPVMAYSPIEQGRLLGNPTLKKIAARQNATPAQVALAWVLRNPGILAIPKAGTPEHTQENRGALAVRLDEQDLAELDKAFPPPSAPEPLEML